MNLQTRKYQIIEKVMHMNAEELKEIETLLEEEKSLFVALDLAMKQIKEGSGVPHNEVRKKYEKWL